MHTLYAPDFNIWRGQARTLLAEGCTPLDVTWIEAAEPGLFDDTPLFLPAEAIFTVPPDFMALARVIACHRDVRRWDLLYQLLFRLTHGREKKLLHIPTDPLIHALHIMQSAIRRDAHKTKAFVRFRRVEEDEHEHYIAWHRPDHRVLPLVADFFARRFSSMRWAILTPDQSVHWDGGSLAYGPGVDASAAPEADTLEDLWRDYYRATFNPARIKLKTMKREMSVRHWRTLPETQIIPHMLAEASSRVDAMIAHSEGYASSAQRYVPEQTELAHLRAASRHCEGCELHQKATQTVFGEGPSDAALMLVGEQPGDEEDKQGRPFAGPAGQLLDEVLAEAGLARDALYITNAVKHFRFLYKDSFRQHQSPSRYHVQACKPWLTAEIAAIKPRLIICLGNTAARALIHPNFVMKDRADFYPGEPPIIASYHPASILRMQGDAQHKQYQALVQDIKKAASYTPRLCRAE